MPHSAQWRVNIKVWESGRSSAARFADGTDESSRHAGRRIYDEIDAPKF